MQEKYVERYEDFEENNNRIVNFVDAYPQYFYIPRDKGFGTLDYIEYNGKALYLIEKKSLPEEIRESLVGGDAGKGEYTDYLGLNDVYGVNSKLKVYYCSNGMDSITNLGKDDIDEAIERDVFSSDSTSSGGLGSLLSVYDSNKDGKIQSSEISSITELEVTENISLKEIYNLYSLEKLIIKEVENLDLTGIENCMKLNYIWFYRGSATNYEPIGKLGSKIKTLYFVNFDDTKISKLCTDINSYELTGLTNLGFWGHLGGLNGYNYGPWRDLTVSRRGDYGLLQHTNFTDLTPLSKLNKVTQEAVKYLWISGNKLKSLNGLDDFKNLIYLDGSSNELTDISNLNKLANIEYLQLHGNNLTDKENRLEEEKVKDCLYNITELKNLYWLDISTNSELRYINYLSGLEKLKYLYMDGCGNLSDGDVMSMRAFINGMIDKTYDSKYVKKLLDTLNQTKIDYTGEVINISDLKTIGECTKLETLDLTNVKVIKSSTENLESNENTVEILMKKVFEKLTSLKDLSIYNLTIDLSDGKGAKKIKDLGFFKLTDSTENKGLSKTLRALDLRGTDVVALGDNNTLTEEENNISKNNVQILNSLNVLNVVMIDTNKFDFSKLQTMVNNVSRNGWNTVGTSLWNGQGNCGLICFDQTSLKTLEKCNEIEKLVSANYLNYVYANGSKLDLSNCSKLDHLEVYRWYFTVDIGRSMNFLSAVVSGSFSFSKENLNFEKIDLREQGLVRIVSIVESLVKMKSHVKHLAIQSFGGKIEDLSCFLNPTTKKCDWVESLQFSKAGWVADCYTDISFYENLRYLAGGTLVNLQFGNCGEVDLNFIKNFTNLKCLYITGNSKIVDISALEPKYDGAGNCISGFPNLEELTIQNSVTDITSVGKLTELKRLNVSENKINNGIESLAGLTNLEYVNLTNCSSLSQKRNLCKFR